MMICFDDDAFRCCRDISRGHAIFAADGDADADADAAADARDTRAYAIQSDIR